MRSSILLLAALALLCFAAVAVRADYTPAALADQIHDLPGLDEKPAFNQFSGYLTVDAKNNRKIFYWYVESTNKPDSDPLVWWTNGGPGCSGLLGFMTQHGPFRPCSKCGGLKPFEHSWNKLANMLFVEAPAGVGFSFSDTPADMYTNDTKTAEDNYLALQAFFQKFPDMRRNELFVAGESYGGHYVPQLAQVILQKNAAAPSDRQMNLKGFWLGNPIADMDENRYQGLGGTICGQSLASKPSCDAFAKHCLGPQGPDGAACDMYLDQVVDEAGNVDLYGLNFPVCHGSNAQKAHFLDYMNRARLARMSPAQRRLAAPTRPRALMPSNYEPCDMDYEETYLNRPDVREAIHAAPQVKRWMGCNQRDVHYDMSNLYIKMQPTYLDLIRSKKLRMTIFSGDDDAICATSGTQHWMTELLGNSIQKKWAPWSYEDEQYGKQVGGYLVQYEGISLVTVHGAGHMVAQYQPQKGFEAFRKFLAGEFNTHNTPRQSAIATE